MKADRIYKALVILSLLLYAFIYSDAHLVPVSTQKEKLEYSTIKPVHSRYGAGRSHILKTERDKIKVSESVFLKFADYDSLDIGRSGLTAIPQMIGREIKGLYYTAEINFMHDDVGDFLFLFFWSLSVLFWLIYGRIKKGYLKERFSILSLITSFIFVLIYFL